MMLDLPQPFGPTMPVMLVGKWNTVGSTKDLKPDSLMVERRMYSSDLSGRLPAHLTRAADGGPFLE